jgi:hypothetical protein
MFTCLCTYTFIYIFLHIYLNIYIGMKLKQAVNEIETKRTSLDSNDNEIAPSLTVGSRDRDSFGMLIDISEYF